MGAPCATLRSQVVAHLSPPVPVSGIVRGSGTQRQKRHSKVATDLPPPCQATPLAPVVFAPGVANELRLET